MKKIVFISIITLASFVLPAAAQTTWDGGGAADTSWGTAANWDNDTLPLFNGTDSLTVTAGFGANTAMTLGADLSIGRITFGGAATAISLSGNTLRLNSTTTTAATGTALWNANTSDGKEATVNSAILLQSGTAGSYTGYFRENGNSNGGTKFNGAITQGAGENWTLRFSRANARGIFGLNNAGNSISAIRNDGADVYSDVVGAFGGASITMAGGFTGTRLTDHYTTAVSNNITVAANSTWASQIQTRLTGNMTQSTFALTYGFAATTANGNGVLTRAEYASFSGTGTTTLVGGAFSTSSMGNISSGELNLGSSSSSSSVFVLSGTSGNNVPTWADFSGSKTYNQAGGAGTWRINAGTAMSNTGNYGGFAARGADLVIPASGAGLSNATFARSFQLGSIATLDGAQYAANSVTIQTDIAYGSVAGANRSFAVAANAGTSKTTTQITLAGPVHELSGQITGDSVILYPTGLSNTQMGMFRISNATNSLTGTSRWVLGGNRATFTTMGGGVIAVGANAADLSSVVGIFTSDGAFGGATEVNVASQNSSSQNTTGTLLFEDTNGSGSTTFTRNINLQNNNQVVAAPAWGSYAGDVIYTGTATHGGTLATVNDSIIHVQSGTLQLGVNGGDAATITNNRTAATTHNKSGTGILRIDNLTVNGTQTSNSWSVRQGALLVNTSLAGAVTVRTGAILGGTGTIAGATTINSNGILAPGNNTGTGNYGASGTLTFSSGLSISSGALLNYDTSGDQIAVTGGTLTLSGGALTINSGATLSSPGTYTLFNFTGASLAGSVTNLSLTNTLSGVTSSFSTSGDNVILTLSGGGLSNNADLSSLVVTTATISPSFASGTTSYTATVPYATTSITVTPTVADANATVTVNTVPVTSGSPSGSISLNPGANVITIEVTAEDSSTKSYTVTVNRVGTIQEWRQDFYGSPANSGNGADTASPFGTGISNLFVYAFLGINQDPATAQPSQLPQFVLDATNLSYTFTEPAGVSGVTYGAEYRTDLLTGSWLPVTDTGSGTTHIFSVARGANTKLFLRLTVTSP